MHYITLISNSCIFYCNNWTLVSVFCLWVICLLQCSTCGKIKTMYNKLSNFKTTTWLNLIMPIQSFVLKTTANVNVVIYFVINPLNIPPSTFCDLVKVMSFSCGYLIDFPWEAVEQTNQQRKKKEKNKSKKEKGKDQRFLVWLHDV